jgi:hypothetical protein
MVATHILSYTPIILLTYQYIKSTTAVGASQGSLLMIHQHTFSLLMVPALLVGTYQMEHSQLMEQKGSSEQEKGRGYYIASKKNSIPGRILLLKVNVYAILVI